jgi:hypothetical protein
MPESPDQPRELFQKESHRNTFNGLLFTRRSGDLLLVPVHEIASVATSALPDGGGCVEIHTRRHLIRLGLSEAEASRKFVSLFIRGEVNHVREGTAPIQAHQSTLERDPKPPEPVTLAIEIVALDAKGSEGSDPLSRPAPAQRESLGFPAP